MDIFEKYKLALSQKHLEAQSLPFDSYHNQEIFDLEKKSIFKNDWIFVCSDLDIPNSGDYYSFNILGESLNLVRQENLELKVISNNCRHRGTPILNEGVGNAKNLVCPYHAWTFSMDGSLKGVPFPGKVEIDKKKHCLKEFRVEVWNHLVFVTLNNNIEPIAKRFKKINKYFEIFEFDRFKKSYMDKGDKWNSNWKLAMENGIESYHLFKVHKETLEISTPTKKAYYLEGGPDYAVTGGEIQVEKNLLDKIFHSSKYDYLNNYILISLPPNFIGVLTYDSFDWINIMPLTAKSSVISGGGLVLKDYKIRDGEASFVKKFLEEDKEICERIQIGMESELSSPGQLVEMEKIVVDFHQYISNRIFCSQAEDYHIEKEEMKRFFDV